jgi:hypothetical protein
VWDAPGVFGEAFIGAGMEGSDRGRWRNGWRWWGASMAWVVLALKGRGSREDAAGTVSRRGGQAARSTRLPWA